MVIPCFQRPRLGASWPCLDGNQLHLPAKKTSSQHRGIPRRLASASVSNKPKKRLRIDRRSKKCHESAWWWSHDIRHWVKVCHSLSIYITHWVKENNDGKRSIWKMYHLYHPNRMGGMISVSYVSALLRYQSCEAIIDLGSRSLGMGPSIKVNWHLPSWS